MPHFHIEMHIALHYGNKITYLSVKDDLRPYKIPQIRLPPGLRPGPRWGEITTLRHTPSQLGRGT